MRPSHDAPRLIPRITRQALVDVCRRRGWLLDDVFERCQQKHIPQSLVFDAVGFDGTVSWVDDDAVGACYIVVKGSRCAELVTALREDIAAATDDDLLRAWDRATELQDRISAMFVLGVGAPPACDERFLARFREGTADKHADIRLATMTALQYRSWPEYVDIVAKLASDPDKETAGIASRYQDYLRELYSSTV